MNVHPSDQRLALWLAACRKEITVEELYRRLAQLRERYSDGDDVDGLYEQPRRQKRAA